jgi:hypothetical protein
MEHKLKEWVRGGTKSSERDFKQSSEKVSRRVRRDFHAKFAEGKVETLSTL